jgi:sugar fermentation stimulation protein A
MEFARPLVRGRFLRRLNRFVAEVEVNGEVELVHVPNTGRLKELLVADAPVLLISAQGDNRKTTWDLTVVQKDGVLCAVDTRLPAKLLLEQEVGHVLGYRTCESTLRLEAAYGKHRFDLVVEDAQGRLWVEAKTVSLVVNHHAYFPDAPTQRGTSHVQTLTDLVGGGGRGAVVLMVMRDDASVVHPNEATDPAFAAALRQAAAEGVMLRGIRYRVTAQGIYFDREIPVLL